MSATATKGWRNIAKWRPAKGIAYGLILTACSLVFSSAHAGPPLPFDAWTKAGNGTITNKCPTGYTCEENVNDGGMLQSILTDAKGERLIHQVLDNGTVNARGRLVSESYIYGNNVSGNVAGKRGISTKQSLTQTGQNTLTYNTLINRGIYATPGAPAIIFSQNIKDTTSNQVRLDYTFDFQNTVNAAGEVTGFYYGIRESVLNSAVISGVGSGDTYAFVLRRAAGDYVRAAGSASLIGAAGGMGGMGAGGGGAGGMGGAAPAPAPVAPAPAPVAPAPGAPAAPVVAAPAPATPGMGGGGGGGGTMAAVTTTSGTVRSGAASTTPPPPAPLPNAGRPGASATTPPPPVLLPPGTTTPPPTTGTAPPPPVIIPPGGLPPPPITTPPRPTPTPVTGPAPPPPVALPGGGAAGPPQAPPPNTTPGTGGAPTPAPTPGAPIRIVAGQGGPQVIGGGGYLAPPPNAASPPPGTGNRLPPGTLVSMPASPPGADFNGGGGFGGNGGAGGTVNWNAGNIVQVIWIGGNCAGCQQFGGGMGGANGTLSFQAYDNLSESVSAIYTRSIFTTAPFGWVPNVFGPQPTFP